MMRKGRERGEKMGCGNEEIAWSNWKEGVGISIDP